MKVKEAESLSLSRRFTVDQSICLLLSFCRARGTLLVLRMKYLALVLASVALVVAATDGKGREKRLKRSKLCPRAVFVQFFDTPIYFILKTKRTIKITGGSRGARAATDTPADVMARNILEWIQGIYRQGVRKSRSRNS